MVYFSRLATFNDAVRRFSRTRRFDQVSGVEAGDPDDCGHKVEGGLFDEENDCAAGGRKRMEALQESWEKGGGPVPDKLRGFHDKHGMLPREYWEHQDHSEQEEMDIFHEGRGILDRELPNEYQGILTPYERALLKDLYTQEAFLDLANQAVNNKYGSLPTVEELVVMAQIGRSVKGQYAAAATIMTAAFGEPIARTWAAANAIVSPNTPWKVHTYASLRLIEEWVNAGAPTGDDPEVAKKLYEIIDGVQKEYLKGLGKDPEKGVSAEQAIFDNRPDKLVNLLMQHGKEIKEGMIATSGRKAVNFGLAPFDPGRVPIDIWMTVLGIPEPDDAFPEESYDLLGHLVQHSVPESKLDLLSRDDRILAVSIKETRKKLMDDPEKAIAYKVAVTKAAEALGWEPREVQETVWAATMSIAMLKAGGIENDQVIKNLTHRLVRESWDMEGVFKDDYVQKDLLRAGVSPSVLENISSVTWPSGKVGLPGEKVGKSSRGEGQIQFTPAAKAVAERLLTRIPRASIKTVEGRALHVPGEKGHGTRIHHQFRHRRRPRRFDRNPLSCVSDDTVHGPSTHSPHYLSSEQVGSVIADQYHRRLKHDTSEDMQHKFVSSTLFELRKVPSWVLSPYRPIQRGQLSHSKGPIIVDRNKTGFRHRFGSFGQNLSVAILDGKHRRNEHVQEHGDSELECYVGIEAVPIIREYLETFAPLRAAFVEALGNFYSDHDPPSWHGLIDAGRNVGLSDSQLRHLYKSFRDGWKFSPPLGRFVRGE